MDDLVGPKPSSQVIGISAGISISGRVSVPGLNSIPGIVFAPRSSRARDLVTMVEAGPAPGWVTHYGRYISSLGRWGETQLARQITATYVTVGIGFHVNYRQIYQISNY